MIGDAEPPEQTERARMLLLDATVAWLHAMARDRPVVVVLDDLQWADESSLLLLDLAIQSPRLSSLSVLGAVRRETGAATRHAWQRWWSMPTTSRCCRSTVMPWVASPRPTRVQSSSSGEVDDLFRRAGGHPFFTRELARARLTPDRDDVPPAIRDAVMARVRRLTSSTQSTLAVASLCRSEVLPDVLATVTGQASVEVERAVMEAREAGMLRAAADSHSFAHDLFREAIAEEADPCRRLHRAAPRARTGPVAPDAIDRVGPAEVARHFPPAWRKVGCRKP